MNLKDYTPSTSYLRVATATPSVAVGDIAANTKQITELYKKACDQSASLVVFPELCITGYSLGDLVRQQKLLTDALATLEQLATCTSATKTAMIVGLPYAFNGHLYNVAALLANGEVQGIVTKTNMPNYGEFYEQRWYQSFNGTTTANVSGKQIPFGQNIVFEVGGAKIGIEICEDMWVANQPSRQLTSGGAQIIANPSASPELVGKATYRKELVHMTSATQRCAYIYAGADWTESTTDIVMSGHAIIAENGTILAERAPFSVAQQLLLADIDLDHLGHDRIQDTTVSTSVEVTVVACNVPRKQTDLRRTIPNSYFLPSFESAEQRTARLEQIFAIQAHGLARRLKAANSQCIVLGLSGGLDSTLALLVAYRAAFILDKDPAKFIHAITMPGPASSSRTQTNAVLLANTLGVSSKTIPIGDLTTLQQQALNHDGTQDITYENIQARTRTSLLFNYANSAQGMVLGTGDLSELALGWCTFGGDHLSHYNVNGSIPKTLIRDIVQYAANLPENKAAKKVLTDIVATPISPELTTTSTDGISQQTEDLVGPYILHDFFLYHVLRYGDAPQKITYLATIAFKDTYTKAEITHWLSLFYQRFAKNQFKRSVMPDGPKVGSVSLSPRGDWRMPSDITNALWN